MVRFIVNICYEILHSLRARPALSVQNDNIIVVVFNEGKRFFTSFRMTPKLLIVILNVVKDLDFDG